MAWSQGNLDTQWALKYWPSKRSKVTDFIALSPDYHGTTEGYLICLGLPSLGCTPAVIQQEYASAFVSTLRLRGGDSAYVPTTTVYSETDEVVQPQAGVLASAFLGDARTVGVANVDVQSVCGVAPAGGLVTHGGVLYNALAHALVVDALTHAGPASLARVNSFQVCQQLAAPGLDGGDVLATGSGLDLRLALELDADRLQISSSLLY
jgi:hypothetical protein